MELDLNERAGYNNRHTKPLPQENCIIKIIKEDSSGENTFVCEWKPFKKENYIGYLKPDKCILGTAKVIAGKHKGIGFHALSTNNYEFIYYKILD